MKGGIVMSTSNHDDHTNENKKERSDEARTVRKIVAIVLSVVLIAIIAVGISGYLYIKSGLEPVDPDDETEKSVEIPIGSSVSKIGSILENNGIIEDSRIFRFYIKFRNKSGFQAGEYQLSPSMSLDEITETLKTGKVVEEALATVTIPEGKTVEQIAEIYSKKMSFDKKEFLEKTKDVKYIESLIEKHPSILSEAILEPEIRNPLEGYLFAATYQFYEEDPSIESIIDKMLKKTERVVVPYLDSINEKDLTVHEAVTMASLVEMEARTKEDRKKIAGVFYNRLEIDMALQTDPTVLYAMGRHKERVLHKDLEVDSPYNTYKYPGLPVGPISNYAANSLEAIVKPITSENLYFVAAPSGEVYYAENYDEHIRLKNKHLP